MNPFVVIGNVYERRDGRRVFVYRFDPVTNNYVVIVQEFGDLYSVDENGRYLQSAESHNDLVKEIK